MGTCQVSRLRVAELWHISFFFFLFPFHGRVRDSVRRDGEEWRKKINPWSLRSTKKTGTREVGEICSIPSFGVVQSWLSCIPNMLVVIKRELVLGTKHMNMSFDLFPSRMTVGLSDFEISNCFHTALYLFFWFRWHSRTFLAVIWSFLKRAINSQYLGDSYRRWRGGKFNLRSLRSRKDRGTREAEEVCLMSFSGFIRLTTNSYRKFEDLIFVSFDFQ